MKRSLLALVAALIALSPAAAQAQLVDKFGINIQSCVVNKNDNGQTNGINVVYVNSTHESPATEVDFLILYNGMRQTLKDTGTFTQGAVINHNLTTGFVGFPWNGPNVKRCQVKQVWLENGKVFGP